MVRYGSGGSRMSKGLVLLGSSVGVGLLAVRGGGVSEFQLMSRGIEGVRAVDARAPIIVVEVSVQIWTSRV